MPDSIPTSAAANNVAPETLHALFAHRSIAVVGASERTDSRGRQIVENLLAEGYAGQILPVHPTYETVLGLPTYPSLDALPITPDAAALCVSADGVLDAVKQAAGLGIKALAAIASGFNESGTGEGRRRHEELLSVCRDNGIALLGPNGLGINNRRGRVHYWQPGLGDADAPASGFSLVLQSGALTETATRLAAYRGLVADYVVSTGNEIVMTAEDYLAYVLAQPETRVVGMVREGIRQPARFLELARDARARGIAIVTLMVGRHDQGREITASHTASLLGSDQVTRAALAGAGIVTTTNLDEWINALVLLAQPTRPKGDAVGVVSLSGGGSAMIADFAVDIGLTLPAMPRHTQEAMRGLHADRPVSNPLDAGGYYGHPDALRTSVDAVFDDPELDVALVCANSYTDEPSRVLVDMALARAAQPGSKPLALASFGSETPPPDLVEACLAAGVYPLTGVHTALVGVRSWARFESASDRLDGDADRSTDPARAWDGPVRSLEAAGLPFPRSRRIDPDVALGDLDLRFPVVLKAEHDEIPHKTEVGAVAIDIADREQLVACLATMQERLGPLALAEPPAYVAYEQIPEGIDLILGVNRDPVFGPVVVVGLGGVLVELLEDSAVGLPPVTADQALVMLRELKGFPLLEGHRGSAPSDLAALCRAIEGFAEVARTLPPEVVSLEVNPVRVLPEGQGVVALDVLCETEGPK